MSVGYVCVFQSYIRFEVFMILCLLSFSCPRLFAVVIFVLAYNTTVTTATVLTTNQFQVPAEVQAVRKLPPGNFTCCLLSPAGYLLHHLIGSTIFCPEAAADANAPQRSKFDDVLNVQIFGGVYASMYCIDAAR